MFIADEVHLTFKVDLKCRKELTPVELLPELFKEQPYEDNTDESAPGAHTEHYPRPDLELRLQIKRSSSLRYPGTALYEYLLRHRHTDSKLRQWL
jgi:hypothetical protein